MLEYIDSAVRAFESLRVVVLTGGEPFLNRTDGLRMLVEAVSQRARCSRIVSNGFWATSRKAAYLRLAPLAEAGLDELNLSTGDDHQVFVPVERIEHAALVARELGLRVVIVVEAHDRASFTAQQLLTRKGLLDAVEEGGLVVQSAAWVSVHEKRPVTHANSIQLPRPDGCDVVFANAVITPDERLAYCCGLTLDRIPELRGVPVSPETLGRTYSDQFGDFLKLWLRVDGPKRLLGLVTETLGEPFPETYHGCEACGLLLTTLRFRDCLRALAPQHLPGILFRHHIQTARYPHVQQADQA